jgi:hypothetical protein
MQIFVTDRSAVAQLRFAGSVPGFTESADVSAMWNAAHAMQQQCEQSGVLPH